MEPLTKDCFSEAITNPRVLDIKLIVVRGGKLDINLQVYAPSGATVYEKLIFSNTDDRTGKLLPAVIPKGTRFRTSEEGEYQICLDNTMSRFTAKVVELELVPEHPQKEGRAAILAGGAPGMTERALARLEDMHATADMIVDDANFYRQREEANRDTAESNNARVVWWTVVEMVIVATVSVGQVFLIRSWFGQPTVKKFEV